ncbi:hypothetical protein EQG49_01195 [Periweissella cryptocerci]|uniref:Uncharacterized protein n=1 Tax=Periweissella cryptocerci TaxID=2506420 RepID=A0A4V1AID9_9LACO|nr:hypothetical protein [Periweissella cryptocerci]QBO35165.1 hypothetical protein EQG49_01195 [Periweissella cryptocerci]
MDDLMKMPDGYELVSSMPHMRNGQSVMVNRYQPAGEYVEFGPREIVITDDQGELVSISNLTRSDFEGKFASRTALVERAMDIWEQVLPHYATGLTFLRIERQTREFVADGVSQSFPVVWIKFGHTNGSYNWVTLATDGSVIEIERESEWDYGRGRRATEMWDNDAWVAAYENRGPQLAAPGAVARA